jgi:hypothetical protein
MTSNVSGDVTAPDTSILIPVNTSILGSHQVDQMQGGGQVSAASRSHVMASLDAYSQVNIEAPAAKRQHIQLGPEQSHAQFSASTKSLPSIPMPQILDYSYTGTINNNKSIPILQQADLQPIPQDKTANVDNTNSTMRTTSKRIPNMYTEVPTIMTTPSEISMPPLRQTEDVARTNHISLQTNNGHNGNPKSPTTATTPTSIVYYAIRKGDHGLTGALFPSHELALPYIDNYPSAEYQTFINVQEALEYIKPIQTNPDCQGDGNGRSTPQPVSPLEKNSGNNSMLPSTSAPLSTRIDKPLNRPSVNQVPLFRKGRSLGLKAMQNPNRRPTKVWEKMYSQYVAYVVATGSHDFSKKRKRGNKSESSGEDQDKGVDFREAEGKENDTVTDKVTDTEDEYHDLIRWVRQQQNEYRYWKEGRPSSMFPAKVEKLREVGFEFKYISTEERIQDLLKFKEINGHYNVPDNHPILGAWVMKQKKAAKKFSSEKDFTPYFDLKIQELKSLGVIVKDPSTATTKESKSSPLIVKALSQQSLVTQSYTPNEEDEQKWNSFYQELVEYKHKHGNCDVPPSAHTPLSYWVTKQHAEYQKIKEANIDGSNGAISQTQSSVPSKLTLARLQRLIDVRFVFRQLTKTFTWEERMEQLQKYKEEHGHVRVPKSHSELGVFVNRQRYEWSKWQDGRPSTMTEERIKDLQQLNFVFCAGRKMAHVDYKNKKSWDERYDDLLRFKEEYGHAVVPQSYPGLGEWVHTQRMYYKKLKKTGKKTPLTSERVMKLADIGFVFDATKRRGTQVGTNVESDHLELMNMQFQPDNRI